MVWVNQSFDLISNRCSQEGIGARGKEKGEGGRGKGEWGMENGDWSRLNEGGNLGFAGFLDQTLIPL